MRVLGFDVGIKNLAFCVVEYSDECYNISKPYNDYWNIINLTEQNELHCSNLECTNPVTQTATVNGEQYYYCGRHKGLHKQVLEDCPIIIEETENKTTKCSCTISGIVLSNPTF